MKTWQTIMVILSFAVMGFVAAQVLFVASSEPDDDPPPATVVISTEELDELADELERSRAALCVALDELGRDSLSEMDRTACEQG